MRLRDILRQIPAVSWPRSARKEADELRFKLIRAEAAAERMRQQRDHTDRENNNLLEQMARMAAEKKFQDDHIRHLEAALSDAREQLRQAQRDLALERNGDEVVITAEGLGEAMDRMRQLRLPGQRDGEVGS